MQEEGLFYAKTSFLFGAEKEKKQKKSAFIGRPC